ncbi:DUF5671 domain-containing protein [Agromyces indicus]|uniref:DUF5671 domain-containing protein n=1 Tax=Agromyces indicus TaxID=758919 RepID=A0ABU1FF94_9MICO|nr:DUF5671 domain-containing protein [Agromyces indicus]MDR5690448.1 DUF5671 domain-containing protein [Agromyces indicus]
MTAPAPGGAQRTVRRLIVYGLLFVLVVITAIGLAGLLERLIDAGTPIAGGGASDLALWLAFTLIGGPLAAVLWWVVWRRLGDEAERGSLAWGLYLTAMYTVSLVVATSALLAAATAALEGRALPTELATGLVWAAVWGWHRWMSRHPVKHPTRLRTVPFVIAAVSGLVLLVSGAIGALGTLLDEAILGATAPALAGAPWWRSVADALVTAAVGGLIWWWHWARDGVRGFRTGFAAVALVVVGVLGGAAVTLAGVGTALWVALRLVLDHTETATRILEPLGGALAAAAVGALVWRSHQRIAAVRSDGTRRAASLVLSGLGLAAAASGIGVIVNATLGAFVSSLVAADTRTLLLAGIAALVVGAPVWWLAWRPTRRPDAEELGSPGRRVYLVAVFGISAVVALIALLVVGFRVFEFVLDATTGASLLDRVRAPLGLLVATALVFAYHFAVWRRDRSAIAEQGLAPARRIARVVLVATDDAAALAPAIEAATGASVTVWRREPVAGAPSAEIQVPDAAAIAAAFDGIAARRVLVLAGPGGRFEVVPLVD